MSSQYIINKRRELDDLMDKNLTKDSITAEEAAKFIDMDKRTLQELACQGHVPFAIGGIPKNSRYTKIPKLTFYNWVTQAAFSNIESIELRGTNGGD